MDRNYNQLRIKNLDIKRKSNNWNKPQMKQIRGWLKKSINLN